MAHRRSLHGTPGQVGFPGFPVEVAASVSFVWFSLERTTSVVAGESREAGNPGTLPRQAGAGGMTKRRGPLQGKGGCWMKEAVAESMYFLI
jgi:hypothetical protein